MQKNETYIGKILTLNHDKKFGFISHKDFTSNLYFRINESNKNLTRNDLVAFSVEKLTIGLRAILVRKAYTNKYGVTFFPRPNQTHIHSDLDAFIPLIYDSIKDYTQEFLEKEINFDFTTGFSECVETTIDDYIVYAIRKGRLGHTRLVLNKPKAQTNSIFFVVKLTDIGYMFITFYCGTKAAREPYDIFATTADLEFWKNHALIYDEDKILPDTFTTIEPWVINCNAISTIKSC